MKIIPVVDYIRDEDTFYLSRLKEVGHNLPGEVIRQYTDYSCTGKEVKNFVKSFQTNFVTDINDRVGILSSLHNRLIEDFRAIRVIHEEHYQEHITGKLALKARIENNQATDRSQYEQLYDLQKQEWRVNRLHHLLEDKDLSDKEIPVGGVKVIMKDGTDGDYEDVKEFRFHAIDNTFVSRNFWGLYPGDILELSAERRLNEPDFENMITDDEVEVEYRVLYVVKRGFDPYSQTGQTVISVPVEWVYGPYKDYDKSFKYTEYTNVDDMAGNLKDYMYGRFSVYPTIDIKKYQSLKEAYFEYLRSSPIGMTVAWMLGASMPNPELYGYYVKETNGGGQYYIGAGPGAQDDIWDIGPGYGLFLQDVAKPKNAGTKHITTVKDKHVHSKTFKSGGAHYHMVGSVTATTGGTKTDVHTSRASNQEVAYGKGSTSYAAISNNSHTLSTVSDHSHTVTMDSAGGHSHIFDIGWDEYNRMHSTTCFWIKKTAHPVFITYMRGRLVELYGNDFDEGLLDTAYLTPI